MRVLVKDTATVQLAQDAADAAGAVNVRYLPVSGGRGLADAGDRVAVNMPAQDPQVGQTVFSKASRPASSMLSSAEAYMTSIRSVLSWTVPSGMTVRPASMGPPETKTVGIFRRRAAMSMPGVILSQLEMQIRASAQWALTEYSTASAIRSRLGRE